MGIDMQTVEVTFPSGKKQVVSYGTRVKDLINNNSEFSKNQFPIIAAQINNEIVSLSFKVEINSFLKPVTYDSSIGANIYRRSLCFLLAISAKELFPHRRLVIGHSLGNGYYYYFDGFTDINDQDIKNIETRMREIVEMDIPIQRKVLSYSDALRLFKEMNQPDTMLLIQQTNDSKIPIYECGEFRDLSHGPLAPNTGMLKYFELKNYKQGFLLRYPPEGGSIEIPPFEDVEVLFSIYKEYKAWGKILNVNSVGKLNELISDGDIDQFILVAETLHNKKIAEIADRIHAQKDSVRVVLIAGPSSSGKTTFTQKLAIQLRVLGFNPVTISLDDYFIPRELNPKDENGNFDFEALEAIDVPLLNQHLIDLFKGTEVIIPDFDFKTGNRRPGGKPLKLSDRNIIIMEGIHGLNDKLTPLIDKDQKYKIYISALTQLNLDDHNRISTTDNRLLRRIVRDYLFRGYSALETLSRWPSVRRGENKNIFPYQSNADSAFNSALDYELAVLKMYATPLLKSVKPYHEQYAEAMRLLNFIDNFNPIHAKHVPDDSILREFIGDSIFKY
ncbi:MAG: nucleoside kinase [Spirochaetota bacterium]